MERQMWKSNAAAQQQLNENTPHKTMPAPQLEGGAAPPLDPAMSAPTSTGGGVGAAMGQGGGEVIARQTHNQANNVGQYQTVTFDYHNTVTWHQQKQGDVLPLTGDWISAAYLDQGHDEICARAYNLLTTAACFRVKEIHYTHSNFRLLAETLRVTGNTPSVQTNFTDQPGITLTTYDDYPKFQNINITDLKNSKTNQQPIFWADLMHNQIVIPGDKLYGENEHSSKTVTFLPGGKPIRYTPPGVFKGWVTPDADMTTGSVLTPWHPRRGYLNPYSEEENRFSLQDVTFDRLHIRQENNVWPYWSQGDKFSAREVHMHRCPPPNKVPLRAYGIPRITNSIGEEIKYTLMFDVNSHVTVEFFTANVSNLKIAKMWDMSTYRPQDSMNWIIDNFATIKGSIFKLWPHIRLFQKQFENMIPYDKWYQKTYNITSLNPPEVVKDQPIDFDEDETEDVPRVISDIVI